jgi:hypothetical protein
MVGKNMRTMPTTSSRARLIYIGAEFPVSRRPEKRGNRYY